MAGVVGSCYGPTTAYCGYQVTETAVGNNVTVDFGAEGGEALGASFTLTGTLAINRVGPEWLGFSQDSEAYALDSTIFSPSEEGTASAIFEGANGDALGCGATDFGSGPNDNGTGVTCSGLDFFLLPADGLIPFTMEVSMGTGGIAYIQFQASIFDFTPQPGLPPLTVQFLVPEPSSTALCTIGLIGLIFAYRRRTCGGNPTPAAAVRWRGLRAAA